MVTSNKLPEKKVVRMTDQNDSVVVPQRTLLGEVNEHITCPLCRGYYIDATTIVECLHSFCRSCIIKHLQVKSYCPVCEMMINSAKPNIKLDKALQDIVYKLVPGLFQREMERRQQFYASRPGTAATATPEQRGEDTERIIFSPEDVISFSLEYADVTDTDSISSKSSDSNEAQTNTASCRRYLQCPAVVNISHLKKFLSMKFNIDCTQFAVDILYKKVPLPDYYTLMDIAYIYNWKRNEPMRFFYQITDYVSIRNRIFEVNRKGPHFPEGKHISSEDNDNNSAPNLADHGSEVSSGADSPMPEDNSKAGNEPLHTVKFDHLKKDEPVKMDEEVEKSQFLNSFELTAKSSSSKLSPSKSSDKTPTANVAPKAAPIDGIKTEDSLKRKLPAAPHVSEMKKIKIEIEKAKLPNYVGTTNSSIPPDGFKSENKYSSPSKPLLSDTIQKPATLPSIPSSTLSSTKDLKPPLITKPLQLGKPQTLDSPGPKLPLPSSQSVSSPKRKASNEPPQKMVPQKTVSPLKVQVPKFEPSSQTTAMLPKTQSKKMPDLKPGVPSSHIHQNKSQPLVPKLRMDLLANNSDPTIDRSKILSQVKSSLGTPPSAQPTGDPLKTLFDSCKINIPSSLSITLTDQKQESRPAADPSQGDTKKSIVNKNLSAVNSSPAHKVPSPPVHNYIEILKLPETEGKKQNKTNESTDQKANTPNKPESTSTPKTGKTESSAKGPVPNLKPIADTKLGKNLATTAAGSSITFQQSFEIQLQNQQTDKKSKVPKTKGQVPKLVPATAKSFGAATKLNTQNKVISAGPSTPENKPNTALDLSTAPNIQQSKAFETMQTIANLAKKQSLPPKAQSMPQSNIYSGMASRTSSTDIARSPTTSIMNQIKFDKHSSMHSRQDTPKTPIQIKPTGSPQTTTSIFHMQSSNTTTPSQPSPRQTRSPSSSPKLVIAEEKQPSLLEQNMNQSNQISSTQIPNIQIPSSSNPPKSVSPKTIPGPSKPTLKPMKSIPAANKISNNRQPITPTMHPNPVINPPLDYLSQPQLMHHALLRHQMEVQTAAWLKARHDIIKNITNIAHQNQNDFNNRDQP